MLTKSVIEHFGSRLKVARALGIQKAAVYKWGEMVPPLRAAQLERLTGRKLRFDPDQYADWYKGSQTPASPHC